MRKDSGQTLITKISSAWHVNDELLFSIPPLARVSNKEIEIASTKSRNYVVTPRFASQNGNKLVENCVIYVLATRAESSGSILFGMETEDLFHFLHRI